MWQLSLQWTAAGCSAWLGFPVRYIVWRRHKQLLRLTGTPVEIMFMVKQGSEVALWWRFGFDGDRGTWVTLLTALTATKETEPWREVLRRVWWCPRAWGFFNATRARSNGGCGEASARCVMVVATMRQPARGSVPVVSLRLVEGAATATQRLRVPYSGDLSGAVPSAYFNFLSM